MTTHDIAGPTDAMPLFPGRGSRSECTHRSTAMDPYEFMSNL